MEIEHFMPNQQDAALSNSADSLHDGEQSSLLTISDLNQQFSLGFRVGTLGFLLDASIYCEIVEQSKVSQLPNVQAWFGGVLNLRGNIVPLIDLHILFMEPSSQAKNRRLLAVDRGKKTLAFWIDGYPQMFNHALSPAALEPVLPEVLRQVTTQCYEHNGQVWLSIAFDKLFKSLAYQSVQIEDAS